VQASLFTQRGVKEIVTFCIDYRSAISSSCQENFIQARNLPQGKSRNWESRKQKLGSAGADFGFWGSAVVSGPERVRNTARQSCNEAGKTDRKIRGQKNGMPVYLFVPHLSVSKWSVHCLDNTATFRS
jgi:hypothetical protein